MKIRNISISKIVLNLMNLLVKKKDWKYLSSLWNVVIQKVPAAFIQFWKYLYTWLYSCA